MACVITRVQKVSHRVVSFSLYGLSRTQRWCLFRHDSCRVEHRLSHGEVTDCADLHLATPKSQREQNPHRNTFICKCLLNMFHSAFCTYCNDFNVLHCLTSSTFKPLKTNLLYLFRFMALKLDVNWYMEIFFSSAPTLPLISNWSFTSFVRALKCSTTLYNGKF